MRDNFVINPYYDDVRDYSEGLAAAKINNHYYFINKKDKIVFPQRKQVHERIGNEITSYFIEQGFEDARFFSENLAAVKINGKWGYINKIGKLVIKAQFDYANDFSDNLALVRISGKYGYINKSSEFVINPRFDYGGQIRATFFWKELVSIYNRKSDNEGFTEGLSVIAIKNGDILKFGYIDKSGKLTINPQFDDAHDFSEGLAAVEINGKWGYIDKTGKFVINPTFDIADDFSGGLAKVWVAKPSVIHPKMKPSVKKIDKFPWEENNSYIDKTGKYVWEPTK